MDQEMISVLRALVGALMTTASGGDLSSSSIFLLGELSKKVDAKLTEETGEVWSPRKYAAHALFTIVDMAEHDGSVDGEILTELRKSCDEVAQLETTPDPSAGQTVGDEFDRALALSEKLDDLFNLFDTEDSLDDDECQSTPSQPDLLL